MDRVAEQDIKNLIKAGQDMWEKDKVPVQKMLREICDEKFK